jgi:hypothetical protein
LGENIIGRFASELIGVVEPYAFACGIRPDELWHQTPAETIAIIKARTNLPEHLTKGREPEKRGDMSPEQIGQQLQLMAAAYKERQ